MNYNVRISAQKGYTGGTVRVEGVNTQAKAKEVVASTHPGGSGFDSSSIGSRYEIEPRMMSSGMSGASGSPPDAVRWWSAGLQSLNRPEACHSLRMESWMLAVDA